MSAIISGCGQYRYRLDRAMPRRDTVHAPLVFAYFGVNPSIADATIDDQTVRKWNGFTVRNGGARYIVGNAFAYRATDVKALGLVADPVGPANNAHLTAIIAEADILVPCWGNTNKVAPLWRHRFNEVALMLMTAGKPVMIFGRTANGDPKHPLMLGYDTPLVSAF